MCSWWRGGVSGHGLRSRRTGQRLSMSLGVVAALLTLQHRRASPWSPGLAADVQAIAAVGTTMRRAQSAEGAAAVTPRLRSARRRASRRWPKLRTSAVSLVASHSVRPPHRRSMGPSGARPRPWIRLQGGLAAFHPCHREARLSHPKGLDVVGALGRGDLEPSLPTSLTAGRCLALRVDLGSRRHCPRRPVSFGPSLWHVGSLVTRMRPELGENRKCSLSASVSPPDTDDSIP